MVERFADPEFAIRLVCAILGLSALHNSAHSLALQQHFRHEGVWSWDVLREGRSRVMSSSNWTPWMGYPGVLILHGVRSAFVLVLLTQSAEILVRTTAIWALFLIEVLLNLRHPSTEGSKVISHIVWGGLAVGHILPRDPTITEACLWFIALQSCVSYAGNGWAKLQTTGWRSGEA